MSDSEMRAFSSLGGYLRETSPEQAVKLARELCQQLEGEPESFHGGVWPENVTLDAEGKAVLGKPCYEPARNRPAGQVEYAAPEFFWNGERSAAADVYSVALILYAGCAGGYLPFQPHVQDLAAKDRAEALRKRMKGQSVIAPETVSKPLKKVMEKALAYDPEDRYITAWEFLSALKAVPESATEEDVAAHLAAMATAAAAAAAEKATPQPEASAPEPIPEPEPLPEPEPEPEPEFDIDEIIREEKAREAEEEAAAAALAAEEAARVAAAAPLSEPEPAPMPEPAAGAEPTAEVQPASETDPAPAAETPEAGPAPDAKPTAEMESAPEAEPTAKTESAPEAGESRSTLEEAAPSPEPQSAPEPEVGTAPVSAVGSGEAPKPDYKVQKDFERTRAARAPRPEPGKRRRSLAAPIFCGIAAVLIIAGVGWVLFGGGSNPEISSPFSTQAPPPTAAGPSATPLVITPAPTETPAPTSTPRPSPSSTPEALEASPAPSSQPGGQSGSPTGAGGAVQGGGTTGGSNPGAGSGNNGNGNASGGWNGGSSGGNTGGNNGGGSNTGGGSGNNGGGGNGNNGGSNAGSDFTVSPASGTVYLTGNQVRVRTGPGTGYRILGSLNKGDSISRTGTVANGWTQVTYGGRTGYISSQYLTDTAPATPEPSPTPGTDVTPEPSPTPAPGPSYTLSKRNMTYAEAKIAAKEDGGLAIAPDEESLKALTDMLRDSAQGVEYVWVGAEYDADAGAWRWSDGSSLPSDSPHWAPGSPAQGHDVVMLALIDNEWKFVSLSSADFDPASETYTGKLGYVTASHG